MVAHQTFLTSNLDFSDKIQILTLHNQINCSSAHLFYRGAQALKISPLRYLTSIIIKVMMLESGNYLKQNHYMLKFLKNHSNDDYERKSCKHSRFINLGKFRHNLLIQVHEVNTNKMEQGRKFHIFF